MTSSNLQDKVLTISTSYNGFKITDDVSYHILHVGEVNSWYPRQCSEEESKLFDINGKTTTKDNKQMTVKIFDKLNIYLTLKMSNKDGVNITELGIMFIKNYNLFDNLYKLKKKSYVFGDIQKIESKLNANTNNIRLLYNSNIDRPFNYLNYHIRLFSYLNNCYYISPNYVNITIFDMHENNITRNLYKNRYNEILSVESSTIIPETPKKKKRKCM